MARTIDWKPAVRRYPSGGFICRILEQVDNGYRVTEDFRRPTAHYDHATEDEAEQCAWRQIAILRVKQKEG